jgi:predicted phage tail protein
MPTEAPNTLRSRSRYKIIDIISEGPIKGLVNGAQSIYLNETPVQNEDGSYNFPNFDPSRDIKELPIPDISGVTIENKPAAFPASKNTVDVGVKITKDNPEGSGSGDGSATRTITDDSLDSVRVTVRVPALTTTNTTTGDITGGKIRFNIYVKPDGGTFTSITSGQAWTDLSLPTDETSDGATGIEITTRLSGSRLTAKNLSFQYAKKTGGVWGSWIEYATIDIPATSSSQEQKGFWLWGTFGDYTKSVTGLEPGIYKAQVVVSGGTSTPQSARQFSANFIEIEGKTVAPYDASYLVELPEGGAPWDIKIVRISDDNTESNFQDDLYWLSYTEIINNRFSWPYVAGTQIAFDAESFGGQVPNRAYDVMGLKIEIPSNYDPYNRTYTGVWDGTFKIDWTDNPAWIFYALLTNKRWGLGNNIPAAQVDKWELYTIAQYCDELVDAPNGEQEPRYTCSTVINSQQEAYDLLTAIASAFRGMIYWANGSITATADMPTDTLINVGPANVIDGEFTYQGASRKSRHSVARVSWNNPDDGYKLNVEIYEDPEAIRKYGYRPIDINAIGCTSRGLARRWGKWQITSDNDAPDTVTYRASFDHFMTQGKAVRPGDVVAIADPNYSAVQLFGRIISVIDNGSSYTIKLDREVTFPAGEAATLYVTLPDGSSEEIGAGVSIETTTDEIDVAYASLPTLPANGATWLVKLASVEPRLWRVFSVTEPEPHIYQVSAMLYDSNKFDKIETGLNFEEASFSAMPTGELSAPSGLIISEFLKQTGSAIIACVNFSWTRPDDARADLFEIQYQIDGKEWQTTTPNLTSTTSIDIFNIVPDTYNFRVRAQDTSGLFRSSWATLSSQVLLGKDKEPEDVTGFTAEVEKYGVLMNWNPVTDIDIDYYEIRRGASWAAGIHVANVKATVYKWEDATEDAYTFWIKAVDTNGNESVTATSTSATVPVEAQPTVTTAQIKGGIAVTIAGTLTDRFAHYELQRKESTELDGDAVTVNALLASRNFSDTLVGAVGYVPEYQYRARAVNRNLNASDWSAWSAGINPGQIESGDLVDGALNRSELFASGVVDAAAIGAAAVTAVKTDLAAIDAATGNLNDGVVSELQLAANAVTEAKIATSAITNTKVADGAVTTLKIAAEAVSATRIAPGAITETKISDGAISTPKLQAGCVTANKILVGSSGAALNDDPNFEDSSAWLTVAGITIQHVELTDGKVGTTAGRSGAGTTWIHSSKAIPLDFEKSYRLRFWARRSATANGRLYGVVALLDATGARISGAGADWYYSPSAVTANTSWTEYSAVIPTNYDSAAKFIKPGAILNYLGTAGYMEIQDLRLEEVLPATLIQDGAIVTDKLAAGAVTSAKVTTGELITLSAQIKDAIISSAKISGLSADKINTGTLAAARIAAGSLAADKITGGALVIGSAAGDVNAGTTTVNGDKITASSITSGKIGAGEIKAVNIEAGTITGEKIAADTITTRELLIGNPGSALNDDPNFEDSSAWVDKYGTSTFTTVADGKVGNTVIRSMDNGSQSRPFNVKYMAFDPEKTYRVRAWVRRSATSDGILYMSWQTYDESGTQIPSNDGYYIVSSATPGTDWTEYAVLVGEGTSYPGTSDAKTMRIGFLLNYAATAGYMEAQDFRIEEVLPATLIKDGAIITDKLAANAVTAVKIDSDAIEARHIKANEITADKLNIGTITEIDANAALISDIITSYTDLTNKPTLGDVAALNSITSTYIENGAVITAKIAAGAITTSELNVAALKAPAGEVAAWSAKGSTAASIALADGVKDVSGNANHGQAYGGVSVVDSEMGKAFSFDGVNDKIDLGNPADLQITGSLTMLAWVYNRDTTTDGGGLFCKKSANSWAGIDYGFVRRLPGSINFAVGDGVTTKYATATATQDTWELLAGVFDAAAQTVSIYKNGVLVAGPIATGGVTPKTDGTLAIGGDWYSNGSSPYFDGLIANPRIYNRALTPAEVKTLYMLGTDQESGVITADRIEADIARIGQLEVYGKNRCPDPAFDGVPYSATYTSLASGTTIGGWVVDTSGLKWGYHKQSGDSRLLNENTNGILFGTNSPIGSGATLTSKMFAASAGVKYALSFGIQIAESRLDNIVFVASVEWYDDSLSLISTSNVINRTSDFSTSDVQRLSDSVTAPANTVSAKIVFSSKPETSDGIYSNAMISAVQFEEGDTATFWVNREQGTITADRVVTGELKSLNYVSLTSGSKIDMDNGQFEFAGGKLTYDGADLTTDGTIYARAGVIYNGVKVGFWDLTSDGLDYYERTSYWKIDSYYKKSNLRLYAEAHTMYGLAGYGIFNVNAGQDITDTSYSGAICNIATYTTSNYGLTTNGKINGLGGFTSLSDENCKTDIQDVAVLEKLKTVAVKRYKLDEVKVKRKLKEKEIERALKEENRIPIFEEPDQELDQELIEDYNPDTRIGAMAASFNKAFGTNRGSEDSVCINDQIGVALRAIQELAEIVDAQAEEIKALKGRLK